MWFWAGQVSVSFKEKKQVMQADLVLCGLHFLWRHQWRPGASNSSLKRGGGQCLQGCQFPRVELRNVSQALWGLVQDLSTEHMFWQPPPAWLSEHCWLCYANDGRWISRFPQPGFTQLCIYYPLLKIQSPQSRRMAHFICSPAELAPTCQAIILGSDLQSCPLLFHSPLPPDCLQDTHRHLHASKQDISWFGKTCQPGWWKCYSICWQAIR